MFYYFLIFLLTFSHTLSETIEAPSNPSTIPGDTAQLSPTYIQPGVNPTYSQPAVNPYLQPGVNSGNSQPAYPEYPTYSGYPEYPAYGYPAYVKKSTEESGVVKTLGTILPILRQAFHMILRIAGKVGLFLLGGATLLVVGGAFTAAVCSVTPLCTLTFMGYGLSKEQVRAMITPDRISVATSLVHEAIDKYQKLQGAIENKDL